MAVPQQGQEATAAPRHGAAGLQGGLPQGRPAADHPAHAPPLLRHPPAGGGLTGVGAGGGGWGRRVPVVWRPLLGDTVATGEAARQGLRRQRRGRRQLVNRRRKGERRPRPLLAWTPGRSVVARLGGAARAGAGGESAGPSVWRSRDQSCRAAGALSRTDPVAYGAARVVA